MKKVFLRDHTERLWLGRFRTHTYDRKRFRKRWLAALRSARKRCGCSQRVQEERTNAGQIENVATL